MNWTGRSKTRTEHQSWAIKHQFCIDSPNQSLLVRSGVIDRRFITILINSFSVSFLKLDSIKPIGSYRDRMLARAMRLGSAASRRFNRPQTGLIKIKSQITSEWKQTLGCDGIIPGSTGSLSRLIGLHHFPSCNPIMQKTSPNNPTIEIIQHEIIFAIIFANILSFYEAGAQFAQSPPAGHFHLAGGRTVGPSWIETEPAKRIRLTRPAVFNPSNE